MKLKRHECKSIKEFNKIFRKYKKYFGLGKKFNRRLFRKNYNSLWYTWIWVDILDPWDKSLLKEAEKRKFHGDKNLIAIIKEVQNNYGWESNNGYKLRGIEISNEDYYYIYRNLEGKIKYFTCVGKFSDINEYYKNEISPS